ncbi:hypothetical protein ACLOAU_11975 [Niabella sp. CJ426]|uniref:hypothetical protein n=1 Tax=Niabella sp. CJ426 TaxID=3393740 RepID=UPI003D0643CF
MNQKNFIKKKRTGILSCAIILFCLTNIISCKKDVIEEAPPSIEKKDYLILKNGEEFDRLISMVSNMSDSAYNKWKVENNLKHSLYDKFVESSNEVERIKTEDEKKRVIDTNFFYLKNNMVYSKNGILLDKVLNQFGVIQIGQHILRYQNNNTFYADVNEANQKPINANMPFSELALRFKNAPSLDGNLSKKNGTQARSVDGIITNPRNGQQYNFELAYQEDEVDPVYRYRTWLFESHIVYSTGRTDFWGKPIWSTNYRVYFQFSLQQRLLGNWINMGAYTNLSFFHIESKVGLGRSGFVYCPGIITYGDQTYPVADNTTPFNHTSPSVTSTAMGAFPTKEIYKTNTNVDMPDYISIGPPLPGVPPSARTYTARIKINIEHSRDVLPDRYFYYEYQQ